MHRAIFALALFATLPVTAALAQEVAPMDLDSIDPDLLESFYGPWQIRNENGDKLCKVVLKKETTIGGTQIEIDPACAKTFPIMGEITAWRLKENWTIELVDALRKTRITFETPDDNYIAEPETDGIFTIEQLAGD
ncbi:AprI/Inh family metalloprotease inhibitor [Phyllobacterium sp. 628]|uniref:AprI/Inh family metalloprotease inhibitor n=1 Tax=Phyllobacterium sp. 628 TaxID=2718938 RepID=UPI00166279A3|nr:AprI/Inh family metalloprotease inhibitor [Phyllobacterium sp. 628]QND51438.1 AprI/Inh family metalloprotease inhibitor [Phyllobacterium sp. 628]